MDWRVPLADLDYGIEEENAVLSVLRSKWLTMGAVTQQFEQEFARATGARFVFTVSNATEALHLACLALGIGAGDEVITPSLSFVATSNAVLYTGAEVRFADIGGPEDLTIDPADIERKITPKTKAIMAMHYGGYPCRMAEILAVAERHGLAVIEDAAHSPGAAIDGRSLGTWGALGCFSFFSNKNLSTGEGGMIVTDREDLADRIRLMRSHGMTTLTYDRHKGHAYTYDVVELGYNYRIDEIRSALGLEQLKKLPRNNALRGQWVRAYRQALGIMGLEVPFAGTLGQPAYHLMPVLLPKGTDRKAVIDRMRERQIQTSIHYPPTHTFQYYAQRYGQVSLPVTEDLAARELTLPLYPTMGSDAVYEVVEALKYALS
jgi:dTDP-4-amino-4,6-dideoxygalactose transaminase